MTPLNTLEEGICENPMLESRGEISDSSDKIETYEYTESGYPGLEHPGSYDSEDDEKRMYLETLVIKEETMEDHLLWQLGMLLDGKEYDIGEYIICNLDTSGYLRIDTGEIADKFNVDRFMVEFILSVIQTFDPAGIAAKNVKESLLIQMHLQGKDEELAYKIVESDLEDLERKNYPHIAKMFKADPDEVEKACMYISPLEPKPGRAYSTEKSIQVIPDIILKEEGDGYSVELTNEYLPVLFISKYYSKLFKDKNTDNDTKEYLKERRERARWVINAILQRQDTIKRIAEFIVNFQKDFLKEPDGSLKTLKLTDVAKELSISESTVSRTVSRKYIQTDSGTFLLKQFFSTGVVQKSGEIISADLIKERIKEFVGGEDPGKPLSDQKIADLMEKDGIDVARRTVSKYRESIKILPTNLRKHV